MFVLGILLQGLLIQIAIASRAGITHCSSVSGLDAIGPSYFNAGGTASTHTSVMLQDKNYQFQCCGVASSIAVHGGSNPLKLRVWRQDGASSFVLISAQTYAISGTSIYDVKYGERLSFREGDWIGWTDSTVNGYTDASFNLNWVSTTSFSSSSIKSTHNWYSGSGSGSVSSGQRFQIIVWAAGSTAPYFKNLPAKLRLPDTAVQTGGIPLITLSVNDIDPDDRDELYVTMSPGWEDVFQYDATTKIVTTKVSLDVDVQYEVSFRVEEEHCGVSTTATLTVTVYDSKPSITNLPAFTTLHEDLEDEQLLYTVTMSDPTDQAMWCKSNWGTTQPFRVKMISTEAGGSEAGIYLMEDPRLAYVTTQKYDLKILCYDTYGHEVSGMYYVNIQENRKPIFKNLANAIEIDAREVISGATVFTISTKDADGDKITFGSVQPVCTTTQCPFAVFDSGEVRVTANLLFTSIQTYTLTIPATDVRQTITGRKLVIHVSYRNNAPVFDFTTVSKTKSIAENSALGMSILQLSATDADNDPLTFYMSVTPAEGYQLFYLTSSGELRTHSSNNIDYEALSATKTFTMEIFVHDTKQHTHDTLTLTITDVNEAPEFLQPYYMSRGDESNSAGAFHSSPGIQAVDPDTGATLTYFLDCGQYASYFSISTDASAVSLKKAYDLDDVTADLPTLLVCSLVVKDNVDNNDTATLYITVDYIDDNPTTFDKSSYAVTVRSDTPLGFTILIVRVSDADRGNNITQKLELVQAFPNGDLFVIHTDGSIHAKKLLNETVSYGTQTIQVKATDPDKSTPLSADIVITFVDASVTPVVVQDRDRLFIEDFRNIWWVSACAMIMSVCVFLVLCMACVACCLKGEPLINVNAIKAMFHRQPKPESKVDKKKKKFGGQKQPVYRHIHSNEILRHSPVPVETTDDMSVRANSIMSGRVSATDVKVKETKNKNKKNVEPSWMDGTATPSVRQAPVKAVAKANPEDWEYLNPRKMGESPRQSQPYTPSEYIASAKQGKEDKKTSGKAVNKGLGVLSRVDVNPSPVQMDNTMDLEDDFRSERLSIASPSSMIADD